MTLSNRHSFLVPVVAIAKWRKEWRSEHARGGHDYDPAGDDNDCMKALKAEVIADFVWRWNMLGLECDKPCNDLSHKQFWAKVEAILKDRRIRHGEDGSIIRTTKIVKLILRMLKLDPEMDEKIRSVIDDPAGEHSMEGGAPCLGYHT